MGLLFSPLNLRKGEDIVWRKLANHFQPSGRAVGGRLVATSMRLVFQPHHLDKVLKGRSWELRLGDIASAGVAPPGVGPVAVRSTLWIAGKKGTDDYFVVRNPAEVASRLSSAQELQPVVGPPVFRTAWTRFSPYAVLVSTVVFLTGTIIRPNIFGEVLVLVGAIYLAFFLLNVLRRHRGG